MIDNIIPTEDLANGAAMLDSLIDQLTLLHHEGEAPTVEEMTLGLLLNFHRHRDTHLALMLAIAAQRLAQQEEH